MPNPKENTTHSHEHDHEHESCGCGHRSEERRVGKEC